MNDRLFYIHIGFPKTATTALQLHVFPQTTRFRYLGKDKGISENNHLMPVYNFIGDLAYGSEDEVEKSFILFQKYLRQLEMNKFGNIDENIPILLSFETFTSELFNVVNYRIGLWAADPQKIFSRLYEFGKVMGYTIHLLLVERNIKELIHSYYAQKYSFYRDINSINTIQKYLENGLKKEYLHLGFKWFLEGNLHRLLTIIFPTNLIHVFRYEDLITASENRDKLEELLGIDLKSLNEKAENVRSVAPGVKYGGMRHPTQQKRNLPYSLKMAFQTFKKHYYPEKRLRTNILWDEKCDLLLQQIVQKYRM